MSEINASRTGSLLLLLLVLGASFSHARRHDNDEDAAAAAASQSQWRHVGGEPAHTHHNITTSLPALCQLVPVFEHGFYFVAADNVTPIETFYTNGDNNPVTFGLMLHPNNDFNILYALTCIPKPTPASKTNNDDDDDDDIDATNKQRRRHRRRGGRVGSSPSSSYSSSGDVRAPSVTFVVGAYGPADPDVNIVSSGGAVGSWKTVAGVGEDYYIQFPSSSSPSPKRTPAW